MGGDAFKTATIEDVASLAGVSIATVSRVMHSPEKVAETTRKKVTAAIARTGYTANALARNLRMQRSQMILVLTSSISDPNFPGILLGLEKAASARGFGVLIGNTEGEVSLEENYMRFISTSMAGGIILLTGHLPVAGWPNASLTNFPPVVAATRAIERHNVSYVGVDNEQASLVATEYLLSLGHREIVYVSGPGGDIVSESRQSGYKQAMTSARPDDKPWIIESTGTSEGGRAALERLFIRDTLPTAFFCCNDDTAMGVIAAVKSRGMSVPGDFSVVGFDDIPFSSNISPALTTVRQPRKQIGEMAMNLLLDSLSDRTLPARQNLLHGDLVIRDSCLPL